MVTIQDTELKGGIEKALEMSKKLTSSILVSEVQRVENIEPLSFFAAGYEQYVGERFFWKDPESKNYLVGLGICKQIQSDQGTDRFFHVEKEWSEFVENGIVINPYTDPGIGPVMLGGFSFDPLKSKTPLWSKYADSLFHIPKYLLTLVNGCTYLTTNVVVTQHDDVSIFEKVIVHRQALITQVKKATSSTQATIVNAIEIAPEEWKDTVRQLVTDLKADELKKVVLARELRLIFDNHISLEHVIARFLKEQKDSYTIVFESNGDSFISASPERLVKKDGANLYSTCLAGSIGRGRTVEEDEQLGNTLLTDEKNMIEHQYVVDMIKAAMDQVCSEVHMPERPRLLKVRDIQHLYTPVVGIANQNSSLLQVVKRLHPTPALGGLPQQEAVEKIRNIEALDRGLYAAPVGWIDYVGNGDFAVAIRSGLIQGNEASLFAGCGIVKDSDAESEYIETKIKFRPVLSALGGMDK